MGPLNMGDAQHPSIRPNGRGGGLVRMDGERDCVAAAWSGASKLEGCAATLVFQSGTGASIIIFWAMLPQIDDDNITCTICITIATEKE